MEQTASQNTLLQRKRATPTINLQRRNSPERGMFKKIHKVYLILALLLGCMLSIGMPFFSEPDGQVHFVSAAKIVGLTPDMSQYGETAHTGGLEGQRSSYQNGTRFEKYYLTKIQLISPSQLPVDYNVSITRYTFWGHLIPAIGVWIGYHIYPSLGVMITVGRLFSMFVYSLLIYFIIKYLKKGRLFFSTLMLCPVVLNQFSSLSYDSLSFVLVATVIALSINLLVNNKVTNRMLVKMLLLTLFTLFAAKTNFKLVLLVFPLVLFFVWEKKPHFRRKQIIALVLVCLVLAFSVAFVLLLPYGGLFDFLYRLFITFVNNPVTWVENQVPHNFISTFVAPYPRYNNMPVWLVGVWAALLVVICLSEEKITESRLVNWGVLGIFIINLLALYYSFLNFKTSFINGYGSTNAILGVQGRYTTPFYLLATLAPVNVKVTKTRTLIIAMIIIVVLSNFLLLFNTLYAITFMKS